MKKHSLGKSSAQSLDWNQKNGQVEFPRSLLIKIRSDTKANIVEISPSCTALARKQETVPKCQQY
jgi:hypothetical protein